MDGHGSLPGLRYHVGILFLLGLSPTDGCGPNAACLYTPPEGALRGVRACPSLGRASPLAVLGVRRRPGSSRQAQLVVPFEEHEAHVGAVPDYITAWQVFRQKVS